MTDDNKIKDYDTLDETQNIKNANEPESEIPEPKENLNIRKIILLVGGLIILITMIFFIFYYFKSDHISKSYTSNNDDKRRFDNQPFQSLQQNQPNNINIETIPQIQSLSQNNNNYKNGFSK